MFSYFLRRITIIIPIPDTKTPNIHAKFVYAPATRSVRHMRVLSLFQFSKWFSEIKTNPKRPSTVYGIIMDP